MERSSFIRLLAAAGSLVAAPFSLYARYQSKKRLQAGFKVDAGKDRADKPITLLEGDTFYTKIATKDSEGDLNIFESTRVKKGGPALHVHYDQDEWWYVLEGEFLFKVGDTLYELKAGDSLLGPRGIPHTFSKTNDGNARLLLTFQPAGKMEDFFKAVSEGKLAKMSKEEQNGFRKEHGFESVGPALEYQKKL